MLSPTDLSEDSVMSLNYVKYQNVQNLTVSELLLNGCVSVLPGGCGEGVMELCMNSNLYSRTPVHPTWQFFVVV